MKFKSFFFVIILGTLHICAPIFGSAIKDNKIAKVKIENGYLRRINSLKILIDRSSIAKKITVLNEEELNFDWNVIKTKVVELESFALENEEYLYDKNLEVTALFEKQMAAIINNLTILVKKINLLGRDQTEMTEIYKRKTATYDALLLALNRAAIENRKEEVSEVAKIKARQLIESSRKMFKEQKIQSALLEIDLGLRIIKEAIIKIKNGQTVIFNPENLAPEELAIYEKHKNDEFFILVETVSLAKELNGSYKSKVNSWLQESIRVKQDADHYYRDRNWLKAVKNYQDCSELLNKILKLYGVSIGL